MGATLVVAHSYLAGGKAGGHKGRPYKTNGRA